MEKKELKMASIKLVNSFKKIMPLLIGVLLLISLMIKVIPLSFYSSIFTGNVFLDSILGAIFGSIAAGNPINSYIIGGELLAGGISLFAITAFIVAWITVGVIQFPAESYMLGKKFALTRNFVSFVLSIIISIFTVLTLGLIG